MPESYKSYKWIGGFFWSPRASQTITNLLNSDMSDVDSLMCRIPSIAPSLLPSFISFFPSFLLLPHLPLPPFLHPFLPPLAVLLSHFPACLLFCFLAFFQTYLLFFFLCHLPLGISQLGWAYPLCFLSGETAALRLNTALHWSGWGSEKKARELDPFTVPSVYGAKTSAASESRD